MIRFLLLLFIFSLAGNLYSQEIVGEKSGYWKFTQRKPVHDSVVLIDTPLGSGTGVVIKVLKDKPIQDGYEGYVLTAFHVVKEYQYSTEKIKIKYGKFNSTNNQILRSDSQSDIVLLRAWVPKDKNPIKIAENDDGEFFSASGLGGYSKLKNLRHWDGFRRLNFPSRDYKTYYDTPAIGGDSGGIVTNSAGELVGSISGGWSWFHKKKVKDANGNFTPTTYPLRTASLRSIKKLLNDNP